jgi:hypothetical protein
MLTEVVNLWTGERREIGQNALDAVVTAYAQDHGNYDTSTYVEKYKKLVVVATVTVTCGDWCAFLNAQDTPEGRLEKVKAAAARLGERGTIHDRTDEEVD